MTTTQPHEYVLLQVKKQLQKVGYVVNLKHNTTTKKWYGDISKDGETHKFNDNVVQVFDYLISKLAKEI